MNSEERIREIVREEINNFFLDLEAANISIADQENAQMRDRMIEELRAELVACEDLPEHGPIRREINRIQKTSLLTTLSSLGVEISEIH
jgi:hypothetical protein